MTDAANVVDRLVLKGDPHHSPREQEQRAFAHTYILPTTPIVKRCLLQTDMLLYTSCMENGNESLSNAPSFCVHYGARLCSRSVTVCCVAFPAPPLPPLHNILQVGGQTLPPHPGTKPILENTPVNLRRCGIQIAKVSVRWQAENPNSIIETLHVR